MLFRGVGRGGAKGTAAPPPTKKKREEKGGERKRERKEEKREKRNQERKEVEPVIPRTCCHGPLVAPRPPGGPETSDRNGIGILRLTSAPPFAKSCLRP